MNQLHNMLIIFLMKNVFFFIHYSRVMWHKKPEFKSLKEIFNCVSATSHKGHESHSTRRFLPRRSSVTTFDLCPLTLAAIYRTTGMDDFWPHYYFFVNDNVSVVCLIPTPIVTDVNRANTLGTHRIFLWLIAKSTLLWKLQYLLWPLLTHYKLFHKGCHTYVTSCWKKEKKEKLSWNHCKNQFSPVITCNWRAVFCSCLWDTPRPALVHSQLLCSQSLSSCSRSSFFFGLRVGPTQRVSRQMFHWITSQDCREAVFSL